MTKTLNNVIWKEFKVKTIFPKIEKCKCGNVGNLEDGLIPYVGATNRNNGTMRYVKATEKLITKGNCVVFICDGQGSVGYSIYKAENFVGSTTLKVGRNKFLNYYNAQFIIGALDKNRCIYSYGYKRTEPRLKNETIYLPVNSKGEPDYKFMEEYIKEREARLKSQYKEHIKNLVDKLHKKVYTSKEWKEFYISEIFEIKAGKRLTKANMKSGDIPFIGATDNGNGITNYIGNVNSSLDSNVLGVNYDGNGVAISFYHPYQCLFTDSVKRFHILHYQDNKYVLLFMKVMILKQKQKYMYGYKFCESRMTRQKIMLPVDSKGEPDYKFMEDYMKYLEQKKLLEYLDYIK